jgi:hypothetical protein
MSWVAELNAINQKTASDHRKKSAAGRVSATNAKAAPTKNCIATIHPRFVPSRSTSGAHRGLMTHGRYSQLV